MITAYTSNLINPTTIQINLKIQYLQKTNVKIEFSKIYKIEDYDKEELCQYE